jgi:AraC family ethanolamine operon transcriptional activator
MPTSQHYRQMVDRFEEIARANFPLAPSIPEICARLDISPRTLVRAVRAIHGTTPSRHRHALALAAARRSLLYGQSASVRDAALRFGFRELGRFAADYRSAFGEKPSDTLRHSRQTADDSAGIPSHS